MPGMDLALAVAGHLVGGGEALQQREAPGGPVALAHDVLVGPDRLDLHRQGFERGALLVREAEGALQLADDEVLFRSGHGGAPRLAGGSARISQASTAYRLGADDEGTIPRMRGAVVDLGCARLLTLAVSTLSYGDQDLAARGSRPVSRSITLILRKPGQVFRASSAGSSRRASRDPSRTGPGAGLAGRANTSEELRPRFTCVMVGLSLRCGRIALRL